MSKVNLRVVGATALALVLVEAVTGDERRRLPHYPGDWNEITDELEDCAKSRHAQLLAEAILERATIPAEIGGADSGPQVRWLSSAPHSAREYPGGMDIAAPEGTPVRAPAPRR